MVALKYTPIIYDFGERLKHVGLALGVVIRASPSFSNWVNIRQTRSSHLLIECGSKVLEQGIEPNVFDRDALWVAG